MDISCNFCPGVGQKFSGAKLLIDQLGWRSQKFSTGGALISGFPSYHHNPLLIYLIHYVTKYFSEKYARIVRKIRLDDSCLNHLTNIPVGFTLKSSYIHAFWEITYQNIMHFADRGCVRTWRNLYRYAADTRICRINGCAGVITLYPISVSTCLRHIAVYLRLPTVPYFTGLISRILASLSRVPA